MESTALAKRFRIGDTDTESTALARIGDTALRRMGDSTLGILVPEEVIIEEILSRLPVKSLLRFKCVSKSWYCLISSKKFIKTHLEKSKIKRLMMNLDLESPSSVRLYHYSLPSSSSSDLCDEQVVNGLFPDVEPRELRLVGCCHGLFCILIDRKYFMLFNPCTRESKKLPPVLNVVPPSAYHDFMGKGAYISRYGFAFNESRDDYQVFADVVMVEKTLGHVYSLKTDCWYNFARVQHSAAAKELVMEQIPYSIGEWGKFVNGKLHWQISFDKGQPKLIKAVDLNSTRLVNPPPGDDDDEHGSYSRLSILDGCLCELRFYKDKNQLDVWVCNDYGVKYSWTKRFTISQSPPPLLCPVCTLPSGEVLFVNSYNGVLVAYNPKENKLVRQGQSARYPRFCGALLYEESLVSLVSDPNGESLPGT